VPFTLNVGLKRIISGILHKKDTHWGLAMQPARVQALLQLQAEAEKSFHVPLIK
jgi:hypothetical protein